MMQMDEKKIFATLKAAGLSDAGVAGLMGNLYAESSLRPNNLQNTFEKKLGLSDEEYTKRVDNGTYTNFINDSAGYGLAQWTYWSRKERMYKFIKDKKKSIGDCEAQLEFLIYELKTFYKPLWDILVKAETVRAASDAVLLKYEAPADVSDKVKKLRADYGLRYFNKYSEITVYYLQLGAYSNRYEAQVLLNKLNRLGYNGEIIMERKPQ